MESRRVCSSGECMESRRVYRVQEGVYSSGGCIELRRVYDVHKGRWSL